MAEVSLVPAPFDRERHLPLLLEADDAEEHMGGYLERGEFLEIHIADGMIGVAVLVREADEVEIWNIALAEDYRGRGLGRVAIAAIADRCTRAGASHLTVGTSDCSLGTIAFYRKAGFRFAGVREGYFDTYAMAVVEKGERLLLRDVPRFIPDLGLIRPRPSVSGRVHRHLVSNLGLRSPNAAPRHIQDRPERSVLGVPEELEPLL